MSFNQLKKDELLSVADFFVVDVESAGDEPTKKEIIAALSAGDDPVTWEQYNDIYLPAQESGDVPETPEVVRATKKEVVEPVEEDTSDYVLLKYERKNPTWQVLGYTFTTAHPFKSVPQKVAEYLIKNQEGFRPALASEVNDYYDK